METLAAAATVEPPAAAADAAERQRREAAVDALEAWERAARARVAAALPPHARPTATLDAAEARWAALQEEAATIADAHGDAREQADALAAATIAAEHGDERAARAVASRAATAARAASACAAAAPAAVVLVRVRAAVGAARSARAAIGDVAAAAERGLACLRLAAEASWPARPPPDRGLAQFTVEPLLLVAELACALSGEICAAAAAALRRCCADLPGGSLLACEDADVACDVFAAMTELFATWDAGAARLGAAIGACASDHGTAVRLEALERTAAAFSLQAHLRERVRAARSLWDARGELAKIVDALDAGGEGHGATEAFAEERSAYRTLVCRDVFAAEAREWDEWPAKCEPYLAAAARAREEACSALQGAIEADEASAVSLLRRIAPLPRWAGSEATASAVAKLARGVARDTAVLVERVSPIEVAAEAESLPRALERAAELRASLEASRASLEALVLSIVEFDQNAPADLDEARTLLASACAQADSALRRVHPRQLSKAWISTVRLATSAGGALDVGSLPVLRVQQGNTSSNVPTWSAVHIGLPPEATTMLDCVSAAVRHSVRLPFAVIMASAVLAAAREPATAMRAALTKLQQAAHAAERLPSGLGPTARDALARAERAIARGIDMRWDDPRLRDLSSEIAGATADLEAFSQGVETTLALMKQAVAALRSCPLATDDMCRCIAHAKAAISAARASGADDAADGADGTVQGILSERVLAALKAPSIPPPPQLVELQADAHTLTATLSPSLEAAEDAAVLAVDALATSVLHAWPALEDVAAIKEARDGVRRSVAKDAGQARSLVIAFEDALHTFQEDALARARIVLGESATEWGAAVASACESRQTLAHMDDVTSFGSITVSAGDARGRALAAADAHVRTLSDVLSAELQSQSASLSAEVETALAALEAASNVEEGASAAKAAAALVLAGASARMSAQGLTDRAAGLSARHRALKAAAPADAALDAEADQSATAAAAAVAHLLEVVAAHDERVAGMRGAAAEALEMELEDLAGSIDGLTGDWSQEITTAVGAVSSTQTAAPSSASGAEARACDVSVRCGLLVKECDKLDELRGTLKLEGSVASSQSKRAALADLIADADACASGWRAIDAAWSVPMAGLEQQSLHTVEIMRIKEQLEACVQAVRAAVGGMPQPARARRIGAAHEAVARRRLESAPLLRELMDAELADRHWVPIVRAMSLDRNDAHSYTLRELWDGEMLVHESTIREEVARAGGERSLETFLSSLEESWEGRNVSVKEHQLLRDGSESPALIRQWDVLFSWVDDDLTSLATLRASPYYSYCEARSEEWAQRLSSLRSLLLSWRGAQRRYLALSNAIEACPDIVDELPDEASRFDAAVSEYCSVARVPPNSRVLSLLDVGNGDVLERVESEMAIVEKALHALLESRRDAFPRLYFVGNDDLLALLAAGRRPESASHLLLNLFPGVAGIDVREQHTITRLRSPEHESLDLLSPIDVRKYAGTQAWLAAIEGEMRRALGGAISSALATLEADEDDARLVNALSAFPSQAVNISMQMQWTSRVEAALSAGVAGPREGLEQELSRVNAAVKTVASKFGALEQSPTLLQRRKSEMLMIELLHERDSIAALLRAECASPLAFEWQALVRMHCGDGGDAEARAPTVSVAGASFTSGLEWYGAIERVVRTPLTDRCYLTLAQALSLRLGAAPFGPAGTGKTETVRALAVALGRPCVVLNADTSFDALAMSRILGGIVQSGSWMCVDEINRLVPAVLSAVSEQIAAIQLALRQGAQKMSFLGKSMPVDQGAGLFVTLNPAGKGYGARTELPDSLKGLFRPMAMAKPDSTNIATVLLFSTGFSSAASLAQKAVLLFDMCKRGLSKKDGTSAHYDFSLRALKATVRSAGAMLEGRADHASSKDTPDRARLEAKVFVTSVRETVVPKLLAEDVSPMEALLEKTFAEAARGVKSETSALIEAVTAVCDERGLQPRPPFIEKVRQLYNIMQRHVGVMLVGEAGHGKTVTWQTLVAALEACGEGRTEVEVLDPKALEKSELFGAWDESTREFRDGVLTALIRNVADVETLRAGDPEAELNPPSRCLIVLDGDVSPDWIESLNRCAAGWHARRGPRPPLGA